MGTKTFSAIATLIGTVIGAGILGLPHVVMLSGFGIGAAMIIFLALITLTINLYLGEIGLRTKTNHHLSGYAAKYLGRKGKAIMFTAFAFGVYSALTAYLIGEGNSLSILFFNTKAYAPHLGIAFWALSSAMVYFGLRTLERGEKLGVGIIAALVIGITAFFWNKIDISNLSYNNPEMFFAPFGVALFALLGFSAMPEVERILKNERGKTKKTILIAYFSVTLIYLLFTAVVLGVNGKNTPEIATLGLGKIFILLGIFTMFTSYLILSTALIDNLRYDYKKRKKFSWLITTLVPLLLFVTLTLTNNADFTRILGIGGALTGGTIGALILLMSAKAKTLGNRKPEYKMPNSKIIRWTIITILAIGTILEIIKSCT